MPLKSQAPSASLDPGSHSVGGQIPDGDYTIKSATAGLNTYNGNVPEGVPAIAIVYSDGSNDYEQYYKAGDNDHLAPSDDGKRFVHPDGRSEAKIYGGGAASLWLKSLAECNFEFSGNEVTQFEGLKVTLRSKAAPKGKTSENPDRVIPLVVKILGTAGKSSPAKASAKASSNGDLDTIAVDLLKQVLGKNTLRIDNLGMKVWMAAGKTPHAEQRQALKNLITVDWIKSRDEFETDGDEVAVRS